MTNLAATPSAQLSNTDAGKDTASVPSRPQPLWLLILGALLLGLVPGYAHVLSIWQHGTFFDSDDAMRLVEVRNLLHGQAWFNMTVARLDPPHGVFMHWSRIVDLPLALLIKMFSLVLPIDLAERATRLVFPLALQALLYLGVARLAKALMGQAAVLPAIILTLLSGMEFDQFQPGRIHHSAPQIMLTIFMLASMAEAVDPAKARRAAIAAILAALSLAISLETLPFIVALAGVSIVFWIVRGADMRRMLLAFGFGLAIALPLTYLATVGPTRWFDTVCDAYSPVYLLPGWVGAVVMIGLGATSARLTSPWVRLGAAAFAAGLVGLAASAIKPICFIDPYHGIDPLVRDIWLKNVIEGFSLPRLFSHYRGTAIIFFMPIALGLCGSVAAMFRETGLARWRWALVAAMSLAATALSFWMIRVLGFASPITLFGGVWCIIALRDALTATKWRELASLSFCLALPFSAIGWALVVPTKSMNAHWSKDSGCLASSGFAPLAKLPPGLVAAPIDAGSHMLALTPLSVLAAPYHRNNIGNRAMLEAMLASPADAHAILAAHHVTYVMTCKSLTETAALAARAPHGLAAALYSGHVPGWLALLPKAGPYQVYVMR
ncbi:MAG: hypothetical protein ACYC5H_00970 [Methylovirgula sp.]